MPTTITVQDNNGNVRAVFDKVVSATYKRSLDGKCEFAFSVTAAMAANVQTGYKIILDSEDILYHYRAVAISKSLQDGIAIGKITCEHISNLLNDPEYNVEVFEFVGKPQECLAELLKGTPLTAGEVDYQGDIELLINQSCTRRAALMQLVALCAGEIDYDGNSVYIRNHIGSTEYREIMDGKNITDLTVDVDSRDGTSRYGIKLYKKLDFGIGDNVHISFSPYSLSVRTRIVSIELNPFYKWEIEIEVGDYRSSINDKLYKIEQSAAAAQRGISDATANVKVNVNPDDIDIGSKEIEIYRLSVNAIKTTYAAFVVTIQMTTKSAGTVEFFLKHNEDEKIRYTEQFGVQDYVRTFSYPFVCEKGINVIALWAVSPDGAATLPALKSWGYIICAYIVGDVPWDGYIRVVQPVPEFKHLERWHKYHDARSAKLSATLPFVHVAQIAETVGEFTASAGWKKSHTAMLEAFPNPATQVLNPPPPLVAKNISDTEAIIELRNPVTVDGTVAVEAFALIVTISNAETLTLTPAEVRIDSKKTLEQGEIGSVLHLIFGTDDMKRSTHDISLTYTSESGNLLDALNGNAPCGNFQTTFTYTAK